MRIAQVVASIADLAAGPSHSVPALCNELAQLGHEVQLHVLNYGGATIRENAAYSLRAYPFWPGTKRLGVSPEMRRGLRTAALEHDVLHTNGLWMMPNLYAAWATREAQCRLVTAPRGTLEGHALERSRRLKRSVWAVAQGPAVRRSALLHATSSSERDSCIRAELNAPIALVENGIYLPPKETVDAGRRAASASGRHTLLYLGRIHPIKGLDRLVSAWVQLESVFDDWDLKLVGPDIDGYAGALRTKARELGLKRVEIAPPVFDADRDAVYASADIYVLASYSENFAMSVAEALAAGVPVVCSKGAPWEALEANGCGVWVDNEPTALAAGLAKLMSGSRDARREMGDRARAWMLRSFSWRSKAREMADAYTWLLAGAESRARPAHISVRR